MQLAWPPPRSTLPARKPLSPSITLQTGAHCRKQGVNLRDPTEVLEVARGRAARGRTGEDKGAGGEGSKLGHQLEPACHFHPARRAALRLQLRSADGSADHSTPAENTLFSAKIKLPVCCRTEMTVTWDKGRGLSVLCFYRLTNVTGAGSPQGSAVNHQLFGSHPIR